MASVVHFPVSYLWTVCPSPKISSMLKVTLRSKPGFPNLFDPQPPCLDPENSATPRNNLYHDYDDYFEIWLIISGIL